MFYSRPNIEPLGWDLTDFPAPDGSKNFEAFTTDGRPVDLRFSGGWLTVERGPVGSEMDGPGMEEVLSVPIAPFGIMDIRSEQLCDILGLTVQGRKIDSAGIATAARGFDWSGYTTYWWSTHLMQPRDDARIFVQRLCDAFPGSILVQPEWGSFGLVRSRQVKFVQTSDEIVILGMDPDAMLLQDLLTGEQLSTEALERVFAFRIEFSRQDREGNDVTGSRYLHTNGAAELGLEYNTVQHREYRIRTEYRTSDATSQRRMALLLSILDEYFCREMEVVNLQTGAVIAGGLSRDGSQDEKSYSRNLREEWLERPKRYLFVGKTLPQEGAPSVFYGARPVYAAP